MTDDVQLPKPYRDRDDADQLKERYKQMLFEPGEAIGIVGAQSISEPATQMTMETYHSAGAAKVSITLGLPRLIEIIDARKNPKTPIMDVYLDDAHQTEDKARQVAAEIQEVKFQDVVAEDSFDMTRLELEFVLDEQVLEEFMITPEEAEEKLSSKLRGGSAERDGTIIRIAPDKDDYDLKDLQKLKKKSRGYRLKGLKGIDHVVLSEEDGEWRIQTAGTNLRKVLKIDGVDASRTISNDLFEVKDVLGVEAARNLILGELQSTLEEQGIGVDVRWLMMIADVMTKDGDIQGSTRYGLTGNKNSVLARAGFEETKKHLTQAAIKGEKDPLNSVVENIIVGQVVPVGTGLLELKAEPGKAEPVEDPTIPLVPDMPEPADEEEEDSEDTAESDTGAADDITDMTVDEVKELVRDGAINAAAAYEVESDNKQRKTLLSWLETRVDTEDTEDEE